MSAYAEVMNVLVYSSLAEGLHCSPGEPFMVTRNDLLEFGAAHDPAQILATLRGNFTRVFGYDEAGDAIERTADAVVDDWQNGRPTLNVIDVFLSEIAALLPKDTLNLLGASATQGISPILTQEGRYTSFHLDPPLAGGGWMFLASGTKHWLFVQPDHVEALYNPATKRLRDLPLHELVRVVPMSALRQATLCDGEFLFFPPAWIHRVKTESDSLGVGGYVLREADRPAAERHAAWLKQRGLQEIWPGKSAQALSPQPGRLSLYDQS